MIKIGKVTASTVELRLFGPNTATVSWSTLRAAAAQEDPELRAAYGAALTAAEAIRREQVNAEIEAAPALVVRAVDASRPVMPERPMIDPDFAGVVWTATIKDRTEDDGPIQVGVVRDGDNYQPRFFGLGKWRDPAPDFGYRILVAWALASQPGLTEEARRAFEVACRDAAAKGGPYCITHTREAVAKLDAALLRVSRGETGQAADGITRVCVVEPATIGTGIGGEPIKIRPTSLTATMHDAQQRPSVPPPFVDTLEAELAADKEYLDRLPTATEIPPARKQ